MTDRTTVAPTTLASAGIHAGFLTLLPQIRAHAEFAFRHWRCPHDRDDAVAEVIGLCWKWYVRLLERGKDPGGFPTTLAGYASRHVRVGRLVCGQQGHKDPLSFLGWRRYGLTRLRHGGEGWEEALWDNTQSPVPDQAAFRIDFPAWLRELPERDRRLAEAMLAGERTDVLADWFGLTPGRVSQLRAEFRDGWARFCGDAATA
jgi:hypothetical protein